MRLRLIFAAVAGCSAAAAMASAQAQQLLLVRPITMIVPFAAGGPTDALARILARHMSQSLSTQIVVENVTGARGTIGTARVAKAAPDAAL
jgi:tripartite-type tricarboxylate transporter receptor subunit TctC